MLRNFVKHAYFKLILWHKNGFAQLQLRFCAFVFCKVNMVLRIVWREVLRNFQSESFVV